VPAAAAAGTGPIATVFQRTDKAARGRYNRSSSHRTRRWAPAAGGSDHLIGDKERFMNSRMIVWTAGAAMVLALGACGSMSSREVSTATGAAVGGVAGAVLTGGSTAGAVGGAVVGGVIGNQVDKNKK
jgi:osmotically inducible lipoprotein OsmB